MKPAARKVLFLAIPYAAFALLLAAVELSVRTIAGRLDPLEAFVTASQRAQFDDAQAVRIFEFDPLLLWRLQPGLRDVIWEHTPVTTNADRLRYDRPLGRKPPGTFRVLCAGDSVTFGFGVPQVALKRPHERHPDWLPYPARLERALRAANPGRAVEVAPLAVPGYSTHQGLAWMRRDLRALEPDLVTVLYGWNDIVAPRAVGRGRDEDGRLERLLARAGRAQPDAVAPLGRAARARRRSEPGVRRSARRPRRLRREHPRHGRARPRGGRAPSS